MNYLRELSTLNEELMLSIKKSCGGCKNGIFMIKDDIRAKLSCPRTGFDYLKIAAISLGKMAFYVTDDHISKKCRKPKNESIDDLFLLYEVSSDVRQIEMRSLCQIADSMLGNGDNAFLDRFDHILDDAKKKIASLDGFVPVRRKFALKVDHNYSWRSLNVAKVSPKAIMCRNGEVVFFDNKLNDGNPFTFSDIGVIVVAANI